MKTRVGLAIALFTVLLLASCRQAAAQTSGNLTVYFLDVGQGDAILIDQGTTEVLIDGGEKNTGAVEYIRPFIDGPLEAVVATHSHADHVGGLIDVLAKYKVIDVWVDGENAETVTYKTFLKAAQTEGAAVRRPERGDTIRAGNLTFLVLNPGQPVPDDPNNNSIMLNLRYGKTDFLFTGDAENKTEAKLLLQSSVQLPKVDILKVGHHGSKTASSTDFLDVIKPGIAVYSAAAGNTYGHPHHETIINLDKIRATIYGTDVHGTVIVTTNGTGYEVKTQKQAPPLIP